jgi:hypothetical protein
VCAQGTNVAGGDLNNIYLEWVAPNGAVIFGSAATTLVTASPQTFTQVLPTSGANVEFFCPFHSARRTPRRGLPSGGDAL